VFERRSCFLILPSSHSRNCLRFKIDGVYRIFVVALVNIPRGAWLLMDYTIEPIFRMRDTTTHKLLECACGARTCTGIVNGIPENEAEYPKLKK
jgi:hypothetical protein